MATPAERFAAARVAAQDRKSPLASFAALYEFPLDPFQVAACRALQDGRGVLVAAPTGSGKTVVGEFAVHLALESGRSCFYTTPIKALSNQKYHDLVARYGTQRVGLLTGDNSINPTAPVIVMTTEVLRNMIYAQSTSLVDLAHVVMDEVHYLADRTRGAVWEEVLIHLPDSVTVTALSATVSNAEEFGHWLGTVRGHTDVIVEEFRPVPLWQHVIVGQHLHDLFVDEAQERVNPELLHRAVEEARVERWERTSGRGRPHRGERRPRGHRDDRVSRAAVLRRLDHASLLPAIFFIFSRAGCDAAVDQCMQAGTRLTTEDERLQIRSEVEAACARVDVADLAALDYDQWLYALERGLAAHHAGLVPVFKEVVERLFQQGLIKCVFATETLALGINMPARSVVLERLVKWNGEAHVELTPGEYTQLTGRAGRRGIDVEGHAVVVWHRGIDPRMLAGLASTRTYPLRSSFRPSYNMAVNLVATTGRERATALLESSFAQYQADSSIVDVAAEIRRNDEALAGYRDAMRCHLGDFGEYAAIRESLRQLERDGDRQQRAERRENADRSIRQLKRGDVVRVPRGRRAGPAVVIEAVAAEAAEPKVVVLDLDRKVRRLGIGDFPAGAESLHRLKVGTGFSSRSARNRQVLADRLREVARDLPQAQRYRRDASAVDSQIDDLRTRMRQHPCHGCDEREDHARWGERYHRLERKTEGLRKRVQAKTATIARQFDQICGLLVSLGYLSDDGEQVTDRGRMLARIYSDTDLIVAECLRDDRWDSLSPAELASVCAALVYESRGKDDGTTPRLPQGAAAAAIDELLRTWDRLRHLEADNGLRTLPDIDLGLSWAAYRWAQGRPLDAVLWESEMTAGDFVRWTKQVIDLLGQIGAASPGTRIADTARQAADLIDRGVVAYSSVRN
jgi:ATP-dependent RNA helicase HelY